MSSDNVIAHIRSLPLIAFVLQLRSRRVIQIAEGPKAHKLTEAPLLPNAEKDEQVEIYIKELQEQQSLIPKPY